MHTPFLLKLVSYFAFQHIEQKKFEYSLQMFGLIV
jgi:hypothetical protein